jgi:hypothetical protein
MLSKSLMRMFGFQLSRLPSLFPRNESCAFAALLERTAYDDCLRRADHRTRHADGREEADVMWSALRRVEHQFAEAGLGPQ